MFIRGTNTPFEQLEAFHSTAEKPLIGGVFAVTKLTTTTSVFSGRNGVRGQFTLLDLCGFQVGRNDQYRCRIAG